MVMRDAVTSKEIAFYQGIPIQHDDSQQVTAIQNYVFLLSQSCANPVFNNPSALRLVLVAEQLLQNKVFMGRLRLDDILDPRMCMLELLGHQIDTVNQPLTASTPYKDIFDHLLQTREESLVCLNGLAVFVRWSFTWSMMSTQQSNSHQLDGQRILPRNRADHRCAAFFVTISLSALRVALSSSVPNLHHGDMRTAPARGSESWISPIALATSGCGRRRWKSTPRVRFPPAESPPRMIYPVIS